MSPNCFNAGQSSLDTHMPTFHEGHTAQAVFITGLAFEFSAFFKKLGFLCWDYAICLIVLFVLFQLLSSIVFAVSCGKLIWHTQLTSRSVLGGKGGGFVWAISLANPSAWRSWAARLVCMPSTEAEYPGKRGNRENEYTSKIFNLKLAFKFPKSKHCK